MKILKNHSTKQDNYYLIHIINRLTIENNSMTGNNIYAYIMDKEEVYDIDTEEDWMISIQN